VNISDLLFRARMKMAGTAVTKVNGVRFKAHRTHYQLRRTVINGFEEVFSRLVSLGDDRTVFIDIGANIGIASLLLAKLRGCRVFAFEPVRDTYIDLCANLALNPDLPITALNLGLSDTSGLRRMTFARAAGVNHIVPPGAAEGEPAREAAFITLDFFQRHLFPSDARFLLKIDVERHELPVLLGADAFLSKEVPIAICCEYYSAGNLDEIAALLRKYGFRAITPQHSGIPWDDVADHSNAFFANSSWT
jgi:FkbM family methyltransferase